MVTVVSKINQFAPVDNNGQIQGTYYLNQQGEVVSAPPGVVMKPELLPYAATVDLEHAHDICTIHASEVEALISRLQQKVKTIKDPIEQAKYNGYIEALNFVVSYSSYTNPWKDYLMEMEEEIYGWL